MSEEHPVIRDKRRVHFDPNVGAIPEPAPAGSGGNTQDAADLGRPGVESVELSQLRTQVAERTADLQRLQAEYANYRKRVDRDREAVRDFAVAEALAALLPVLDDIGRAREHGELEGGFKQVAESLEATVAKLGLTKFGEPGDPFDPAHQEAMMHSYSDDVTGPTAVQIFQPGYAFAGRVVRPARVAVAEPTGVLPESENTDPDASAAPPSAPSGERSPDEQ